MTTAQKAILALIIANTIWGAAGAIFKISLTNIPPFTLAFWRFFFGMLILLTIFGPKVGKAPKKLFKKDFVYLALYALSGITINIIFYFLGLQNTLSINAPVIASSGPILISIFAVVFLKEKLKQKKILGLIIGTLGIITIIVEPLLFKGMDGSFVGNFYFILATLGAVGQTIVGRKILPRYEPFMFTFWAFLIATITFIPFAVYEKLTFPGLYESLTTSGYLGIFYGAIFSSVLGYGLFAWGLSKIPATDATMYTYIDPIAGTIAGFILLREPITLPFICGSALIFIGILIAEGRIHYHPIYKLKKKYFEK